MKVLRMRVRNRVELIVGYEAGRWILGSQSRSYVVRCQLRTYSMDGRVSFRYTTTALTIRESVGHLTTFRDDCWGEYRGLGKAASFPDCNQMTARRDLFQGKMKEYTT